MFVDDMMEQAYSKNNKSKDAFLVLLKSLQKKGNLTNYDLKQANNYWKLFCSRHNELRPEGFIDVLCSWFPDQSNAIHIILK